MPMIPYQPKPTKGIKRPDLSGVFDAYRNIQGVQAQGLEQQGRGWENIQGAIGRGFDRFAQAKEATAGREHQFEIQKRDAQLQKDLQKQSEDFKEKLTSGQWTHEEGMAQQAARDKWVMLVQEFEQNKELQGLMQEGRIGEIREKALQDERLQAIMTDAEWRMLEEKLSTDILLRQMMIEGDLEGIAKKFENEKALLGMELAGRKEIAQIGAGATVQAAGIRAGKESMNVVDEVYSAARDDVERLNADYLGDYNWRQENMDYLVGAFEDAARERLERRGLPVEEHLPGMVAQFRSLMGMKTIPPPEEYGKGGKKTIEELLKRWGSIESTPEGIIETPPTMILEKMPYGRTPKDRPYGF